MNAVLDVLRLRRVLLDYVSPPICQILISGSGSSLTLIANDGPDIPTGLTLLGQCSRFLAWDEAPGAQCTTLYKAQDPSNPATLYTPVGGCVPRGSVAVCSPGWWKYTTLTADGVESAQSDPIFSSGTQQVVFNIKQIAGAVRFNLYKNPDITTSAGTYPLVLSSALRTVIEICDQSGGYRLQVITDDGVSDLSSQITRTEILGCCPPQPCPAQYKWDPVLCSCTPGSGITNILGPLSNGCPNVAYTSELTVVGGGAGPFLWELVSGSLPPGLVFHTGLFTGTTAPITGIPTTGGSYSFTVQVTSQETSSLSTQIRTFSINVVSVTQSSPLPAAFTDTPYSLQLTGVGGVAPYSFAVDAGAMPTGITLSSSGLVSGTPHFPATGAPVVGVTDATSQKCEIPLALSIGGCPTVSTFPTIPQWGADNTQVGTFDHKRRIMWLVKTQTKVTPPYQDVWLIDTTIPAYVGNATDSANHIGSAANGSTANGCGIPYIDTMYNQCVIGGSAGHVVWYDLDTKNCLAATQPAVNPVYSDWNVLLQCYDSKRGLIYKSMPSTNAGTLDVIDCNPTSRAQTARYTLTGHNGGGCVYSPGADKVYLLNSDGGTLFHIWDPVTHAFTFNQGPVGTCVSIQWVRGADLVACAQANGTTIFINPNAGNAVVGSAFFNPGATFCNSSDYNDCNGLIYLAYTQGGGARSFDPANGFNQQSYGTGHTAYAFAFDQYSNRLFVYEDTTGPIETF